MIFRLHQVPGALKRWAWTLEKPDEPIASAPKLYDTEVEARSAIAKARIAMRGALFAKVVLDKHDSDV